MSSREAHPAANATTPLSVTLWHPLMLMLVRREQLRDIASRAASVMALHPARLMTSRADRTPTSAVMSSSVIDVRVLRSTESRQGHLAPREMSAASEQTDWRIFCSRGQPVARARMPSSVSRLQLLTLMAARVGQFCATATREASVSFVQLFRFIDISSGHP